MSTGAWEKASIDPSAGVRLVAPRRLCTRCGVDKGPKYRTRAGMCESCQAVLTSAEQRVWKA
jgi:hypothetical protein